MPPTAASTGSWSWPASPTPPQPPSRPCASGWSRDSHRSVRSLRLRSWILLGALLLALIAGIYAGTGRYQAWQAYQSRPDPLAGLSPRDLQDKAAGRPAPAPASQPRPILDGWAELGQLYLYRDEYDNALLAYQRLALQEGGASAATQAAQATVLDYQAGQQLTPEAQRLLR